MNQAWIFQYNPRYGFDLMEYLKQYDPNDAETPTWSVNQHRKKIKKGDEVFFWKTQPDSGIYVIGRTLSDPFASHEPTRFGAIKCYVQFDYVLNKPILRKHLLTDPDFTHLSVLRNPKGTNFPVSPKEREILWEFFKHVGISSVF
ncbi:EVE domain-containing protein [Paenactinomyces guangxiensis]|uniref:EVE domain-containing protein n=1 Tax=Paenactinomyces guangxiensis TaxID=1490290 RepID=A0A7W2A6N3_9BACL|nr:EVE domain-containing protein [Paenactinomyces guangxiensis]MBA4493576.1 EVE domain-containing protein [Paenactinomyces guangxiensis]MBH8590667.1 EVE domain-containing protein [Paenactinomyces guangxiensis]